MAAVVACAVAAALAILHSEGPAPIMTPFYSAEIEGPAFLLECQNSTQQPRAVWDYLYDHAWRLDGVLVDPGGVGGSIGNASPIAPNGMFRSVMVLHPSGPFSSSTRGLGPEMYGRDIHATLTPGRHTVAFRCAGAWSQDVEFYWFPGRQ
jgi:hypothetical protein